VINRPGQREEGWAIEAWGRRAAALVAVLLAVVLAGPGLGAEGSPGRPPVSVSAYLPPGQPDGATDNTAGVQAAVDAVQRRGGGEVFFPAGTYVVTSIRLYDDVTIRGAGPEATVFKAKARMTAADRLLDDGGRSHVGYDGVVMFWVRYGEKPVANVTLRDLAIDGNAAAQTFDGAKNLHGFYLNGVTNALIENVVSRNCLGFGGILKEATHCTVRRSRFDGNGQNLRPGYWKTGSPPGGDGFDLISRCSDNLVTDTSATGNLSAGFEDEGRLGTYNPVNRNARNRWVNLVAADNRDNGLTLLWADAAQVTNVTIIGGATGPNAAGLQVIGCDDVVVTRLEVRGSHHDAVRVWPEIYGERGVTKRLTVAGATLTDSAGRALVLEGVRGARVEATVRGVGGGTAVDLAAVGYGRTAGYGKGAWRSGEAYTARRGSPTGVGSYVVSDGAVYELVESPPRGGRSVTAPSGGGRSPDGGGAWEFRNRVASEDVELQIDYEGEVGARARYGIHAVDAVRVTIKNSRVSGCSDHNIWLEGRTVDPTLLETRSTRSGARGLEIDQVQGTARLSGLRLEHNALPPLHAGRTLITGKNVGLGEGAQGAQGAEAGEAPPAGRR
jgi:hypothetical protein